MWKNQTFFFSPQVACFERTDLPPEAQLSAFPALEQENVAYFRGILPPDRQVGDSSHIQF